MAPQKRIPARAALRRAARPTARTEARRPTIPETMQAAAIDRFGPPSVLEEHELPVPELGPREILIAVHTAGVGIWDAKIREGVWAGGKEKFPLVLGIDGSGTIA